MIHPDLAKAIKAALRLSSEELTPEHLSYLTELNVHYKFINSLEGLERAVNLRKLVASGNNLSDITPLGPLTNLVELDLHWCQITDLAPLANLRNLQDLDLHDNHIFHIEALRGLTQLDYLDLDQNIITDLRPLQGLTNLRTLCLGRYTDNPIGSLTAEMYGNPYWEAITDISPLASLTQMEFLSVTDHGLDSIDAVRNMKNLETLTLSALVGPGKIIDIAPLA
nr:leucine-rich repeat domain-containing protein [Candidatus Sigynarchaeota archaeon]